MPGCRFSVCNDASSVVGAFLHPPTRSSHATTSTSHATTSTSPLMAMLSLATICGDSYSCALPRCTFSNPQSVLAVLRAAARFSPVAQCAIVRG